MRGGEDSTENDAYTSDDNVRNAEERVAATHDCAGGDEHRLGTAVLSNGEV